MFAGGLFTQYFLQDGIRQTEAYQALDAEAVEAVRVRLAQRWRGFATMPSPSEAETEAEFYTPP